MSDIFISYAREDQSFVRRLGDALEADGREAWVDWEGIQPTADWMREIYEAIEAAETFVFVISPDSVASSVCKQEIEHAVEHHKRLAPILYREVESDASLEAFAKVNWIFCRQEDDFDDAYRQLVDALDTDLEWVRAHTRLVVRAEEWKRRNRDDGYTLHGSDLEEAETWLALGDGLEPIPTQSQREYITTSRRLATRRQRRILAAVSIALVVTIALAVLSLFSWREAVDQRQQVKLELARSRVQHAIRVDGQGEIEAGLAQLASALRLDPDNSVIRSRIYDALIRAPTPATPPLVHEDEVTAASFSRDGRFVVTGAGDGAVQVWDSRSGTALGERLMHDARVRSVSFDADGSRVVTASYDGTVRMWDWVTGNVVWEQGRSGQLGAATLSPDGGRVIAPVGPTAMAWDARTGAHVISLGTHRFAVDGVSFSADGSHTLVWSASFVTVWQQLENGQSVTLPERISTPYSGAWLSGDGRFVLVVFQREQFVAGEVAQMWNVESQRRMWTSPSLGQIRSVSFSSSDDRVLIAADEAALILDARSGTRVGPALKHAGSVWAASFSPDDRFAVTASWDGTAQVWDVASGRRVGAPMRHSEAVKSASFSPDGSRVLSVSDNRMAQLWFVNPQRRIGAPMVDEVPKSPAPSNAVGELIVEITGNTAQISHSSTEASIGKPLMHDKTILKASFSPDGELVATASDDHTVRIWRTSSGEPVAGPFRHEESVFGAEFSPDGARVVTQPFGRPAQVWEVFASEPTGLPLRQEGFVDSARFSPDGERVVTSSRDKTAQVWDATTGERIGPPMEHRSGVNDAFFIGSSLVTKSDIVLLWDAREAGESAVLSSLAEAVGGYTVRTDGIVVPIGIDRRRQELLRWKTGVSQEPESVGDLSIFVDWLFAHPWTRSVSAATRLSVPEYILRFPAEVGPELIHHPLYSCRTDGGIDRACADETLGKMTDHGLISESERTRLQDLY